MSSREIIIEPDPILRKKSENLEKVDTNLQKLMDDMLSTMYGAPGIGLAAVQIGILKRVIVIDVSKEDEKKMYQWAQCTYFHTCDHLRFLETHKAGYGWSFTKQVNTDRPGSLMAYYRREWKWTEYDEGETDSEDEDEEEPDSETENDESSVVPWTDGVEE